MGFLQVQIFEWGGSSLRCEDKWKVSSWIYLLGIFVGGTLQKCQCLCVGFSKKYVCLEYSNQKLKSPHNLCCFESFFLVNVSYVMNLDFSGNKVNSAAPSLWLAQNPSKRWGEVFFLLYTPFWLTLCLGIVVPFKLYEVCDMSLNWLNVSSKSLIFKRQNTWLYILTNVLEILRV